MKIIITKKQYKDLIYNLIDTVVGGGITLGTDGSYITILDSYGEEIMNIFSKKNSGKNVGCKNDLGLTTEFNKELEKYIPFYKHKSFSKVLIDYVYDKVNIKCDCIDYWYDIRNDGNDKRFAYNLKTKKKYH